MFVIIIHLSIISTTFVLQIYNTPVLYYLDVLFYILYRNESH